MKAKNIRTNNILLVPSRREILRDNGEVIRPTRLQFNLIYHLVESKNEIVSRESILENVWKNVPVMERTIDVHISWIRKTFGHNIVDTVRSFGYIWNDNFQEESWEEIFSNFYGENSPDEFTLNLQKWLINNYQIPKKL